MSIADSKMQLLTAGARLAERAAASFSMGAVCAEAGVPESAFAVAFGDEEKFLVELHGRFLSQLLDRVIAVMQAREPGLERLQSGVDAFLDVCLEHRGLRQLLLNREVEPALLEVGLGRRRGFMQMLALEFDAIGWLHSAEAARLYRIMIEEASKAELEAGRALPEIRQTLFYFVRA
jgi:AcrR family transcriptional regulator